MIKKSPKRTALIAALAIGLSGTAVYLTVRSWDQESLPNKPASRSRPDLFSNRRSAREVLGLTQEQIGKFHAVERKYIDEINALRTGKLTRAEKAAKFDEITLKINEGVASFLTQDQNSKLLELEKEEGRFRTRH